MKTYSRDRGQGDVGFIAAVAIGLLVVTLLIGGFVWLVGGTWSKTDSASAACVYNGGPFDNKSYKGDVEPGSGRTYQGFASSVIEYPIGIVQLDASDGMQPIAVSVGGFTQVYNPVVSFTIASYQTKDPKGVLKPQGCQLIEQHLRRLNATDFNDDVGDSRWVNQFLLTRVAPAVKDALPRVLSNGDPTDLFLNQGDARDKSALTVAVKVQESLKTSLGGNYFCSTTYRYGQPEETCGTINVVLPEPTMDAADLAIIRAPQEARTKATNDIDVANERARAAAGVAAARTQEATSAAEQAAADKKIAEERRKSEEVLTANSYLWCEYLVSLGQDCALVKAAENKDFPTVIGADAGVVIPVEPTPAG